MDEQLRLDELHRYDVLDAERDPALDRLAALAAHACGTPYAFISILAADQVFRLASHGATVGVTPRTGCLCNETIRGEGVTVFEDTTHDQRVAGFEEVTGPMHVRFYAGAPLSTPRGQALGALCVLDRQPRQLPEEAQRALLLVRDEIMLLLEQRRELVELRRSEGLRQEAVEALLAVKTDLEARVELRTREVEAARERVQTTASRLAEAQAVAHVGSWEWSVADNRVVWSEEMHRIYGVPKEQFAGTYEGFLARVHPDDLDYTKQIIGDAYQQPKKFRYDHRILRSDGATRMLHTVGEAIADRAGRVLRMVGTCWDTTEQWQATQALERAAAVVQTLVEATPQALLIVDAEGRVQQANAQMAGWFAVDPALLAHGSDAAQTFARIASRLADGDALLALAGRARATLDEPLSAALRLADGRALACSSTPFRSGSRAAGRVWTFALA
jgi:PAS domain S-box-containing protein